MTDQPDKEQVPFLDLISHPQTPPASPFFKVWVEVERSAAFGMSATLNLTFSIGAPATRFILPDGVGERRDGLWKSSCVEAFLRQVGEEAGYREWNFAPSGDWAAYDFTAYRQGMVEAAIAAPPYIRMEDNLTWWTVGATIGVPADEHFMLGLAAVLEEVDGTKSLWALAHSAGAPDFHHPDCFMAKLP